MRDSICLTEERFVMLEILYDYNNGRKIGDAGDCIGFTG